MSSTAPSGHTEVPTTSTPSQPNYQQQQFSGPSSHVQAYTAQYGFYAQQQPGGPGQIAWGANGQPVPGLPFHDGRPIAPGVPVQGVPVPNASSHTTIFTASDPYVGNVQFVATEYPDGTTIVQEVPVHSPYKWSTGWILLALGFIMPICWVVGAFLPFCSRNINDKRAAMWCISALSMAIMLVLVFVIW
eukprot:jgi/Chrzof1/14004/Cz08g20250.t1